MIYQIYRGGNEIDSASKRLDGMWYIRDVIGAEDSSRPVISRPHRLLTRAFLEPWLEKKPRSRTIRSKRWNWHDGMNEGSNHPVKSPYMFTVYDCCRPFHRFQSPSVAFAVDELWRVKTKLEKCSFHDPTPFLCHVISLLLRHVHHDSKPSPSTFVPSRSRTCLTYTESQETNMTSQNHKHMIDTSYILGFHVSSKVVIDDLSMMRDWHLHVCNISRFKLKQYSFSSKVLVAAKIPVILRYSY